MPRRQNHKNVDIAVFIDDDGCLYTTGDSNILRGHVRLSSLQPLENLSLQATLEGSSFTCIRNKDQLQNHLGRIIGKHLFLKMSISLEDELRSMRPGQSYSLAFHCVIPSELPYGCNHTLDDARLRTQHLQMPPSMVLDKRVILEDGITVHAAKITYGIRAVLRSEQVELGQTFCSVELRPPRLPTSPSQPETPGGEALTQSVSLYSGQAGKLMVESEMRPGFSLPQSRHSTTAVPSNVNILLRYEPATPNSYPPEISKVDIKVKSTTYYSARPFRSAVSVSDSKAKGYRYLEETLLTSSITLGKLAWQTLLPDDSPIEESVQPQPSSPSTPPLVTNLTTTIFVPYVLPVATVSKLLPTFDTCLVSRQYNVDLSMHFPNTQYATFTFSLPLIVTHQPSRSSEAHVTWPPTNQVASLVPPPDYSADLLEDLPPYEPGDVRLVQNDGQVQTFAYVKGEPWLNIHNVFKHSFRKLKGHFEVWQARKDRGR